MSEKETRENAEEQNVDSCTHIVVVLDKSISMNNITRSTISGFNEFMQAQREVSSKATASLMQFDTDQIWSYKMMPVKETVDINNESYMPDGGGTALCDSIARAVHCTEDQIKGMEVKPDNIVVVVITDGEENSSHEFNKSHVTKIIESHEADGWDFVFLGANQDAISEGGSIGVRASNAMTYAANDASVQTMYLNVSKGLTSYRSARSTGNTDQIGFFAEETEEIN